MAIGLSHALSSKARAASASVELAAGIGLLLAPALALRWLFDVDAPQLASQVARLAGVALIALGIACWPVRPGPGGGPALRALVGYNLLAGIYLAYLGGFEHLAGPLLWPGVALHALMLLGLWLPDRAARQRG